MKMQDNMNFDNLSLQIAADWKFSSDYFQAGSLEENNLIIRDASGHGNDLQLNASRLISGKNAGSFMKFSVDNIFGDAETESLWMEPLDITSGKKTGVFLRLFRRLL